jgi:uncharacterized membrane protein
MKSDDQERVEQRIPSLDILRGLAMVLMAIDHVRVFSGVPAGGPTPAVFFTRWVTHFCAPAFFFLAGTGIFLHRRKLEGPGQNGALARFLLLRGAWLIFLELTVIRFSWTFNFDYRNYALAGVIWALGWCMILMAGLIVLPVPAVGTIGVAIIVLHNLMDPRFGRLASGLHDSGLAWLWKILYFGFADGPFDVAGVRLIVLYSLVPWIGVMAAGYAFGTIMLMDPGRRRSWCLAIGGGAVALFLVLRGFDLYGDPRPWHTPHAAAASASPGARQAPPLLRFLNTTKYPASLLFLLMTLGPMIAAVPALEKARCALARVLLVYGRVPFFYYVLHIPIIHVAALVVSLLREGRVNPWLFANHPMMNPPPPDGYTWSLPLLYGVTLAVVALLYVPCRWLARLKDRRREAWLTYI